MGKLNIEILAEIRCVNRQLLAETRLARKGSLPITLFFAVGIEKIALVQSVPVIQIFCI